MAKHLQQSAVRRTATRRAVRLASITVGTAALAVSAVWLEAGGAVTGLMHVAADGSAGNGSAVAAASPASEVALQGADEVSAPLEAQLSYSRSAVLTAKTEEAVKLAAASAERLRPAPGTLMAPLEVLVASSPYGERTSPITGEAREFHWGLDFSAPCGAGVHAADAGVVRAVGWHPWGGGNRVELDHGNGLITTYNHLEGAGVLKGQTVQAGDPIAKVGTTGASTGCHLHFETILDGSHADPGKWILQPLLQPRPASSLTMTDYGAVGTPSQDIHWNVTAAQRHIHDAAEGVRRPAAKTPAPAPLPAPVAAPSSSPISSAAIPAVPAPMPSPLAPSPAVTQNAGQLPAGSPDPAPTDVLVQAVPLAAP